MADALRGIVLDIGGTLLDTDELHRRAWVDLLRAEGLDSESNVATAHGGLRDGLDTFATARLILGTTADADRLARAKQALVGLATRATAVDRTLRWLDAQHGAVAAAISFSDEAWSRRMLQSAGILDRFAFTLGRVDHREIDKGTMLDRAMRLLTHEWNAPSVLYVGDTDLDVDIAAACGIDFLHTGDL